MYTYSNIVCYWRSAGMFKYAPQVQHDTRHTFYGWSLHSNFAFRLSILLLRTKTYLSVQLGRIMRMRLLMMHLWQELVRTCSWIWMPNSTVLRRRCFARSLYWLYFRHQCWHRCYRESQTYPEAGRESRDPLSCERYVPERWLADLPRPSTVTPATSSLGYSSRSTVSGNSHASYGCRQAHRKLGQIYNRELFC